MNPFVVQLNQIAAKPERTIIGLMSGTSVDGLDIALCRISGSGMDTVINLQEFITLPYDADFKAEIASVFSKKTVDLQQLCLLNGWIAEQHAALILQALKKWMISADEIDIIASHGQTIFHAPKSLHQIQKFGNGTLQLGDGDHMAVRTGIITLSDFRQKHIAAGGEGAPLAAYGDYLIFSRRNENRIMLNIGGIANFTFLPGDLNPDLVFCSDTGTGNTLMDAFIQKIHPGIYYDADAAIASQGSINEALLTALLDHPFFSQDFPKTTGPELFNLDYLSAAKIKSGTESISYADTMATLNRFSAEAIAGAIRTQVKELDQYRFFVSGGGMHNPLLMKNLQELLPGVDFRPTAELEINPDAKEAVLFAVLANEWLVGGQVNYGKGRNGIPTVSMGKLSFPG
ncbi:anhydro-N-acetylmuramic acid kinase [Flavihumibacter sp. UBA7668]|uniref:anhydro-N-acetylmuramic acid kinase n=1 Tax=Flavihumibacter sp. UBA7668 TaxID=1946542 RepID=UPI0025C5FF6B|nr:anhydro-N-acetylmuramic acid kinase [Flavihumibacter sp. UBA7668]